MQNIDCGHVGHRVYVMRVFSNGTKHYGIQCLNCLRIIKAKEHNFRPWIRFDEIPLGRAVHAYIEPEQAL